MTESAKTHKFTIHEDGNKIPVFVIYCVYCGLVAWDSNYRNDNPTRQEIASKGCPCSPQDPPAYPVSEVSVDE